MSKFPFNLVDLTHLLAAEIPTWDGSCGFEHHVHIDYDKAAPYQFRVHKIRMNEGIGTHMDAPAHCVSDGLTIDQIPLADLVAPCVVIDVSERADERYIISPEDIKDFEAKHGSIAPRSVVLFRTGWEDHWINPAKYHNNHLFPCVSPQAAELLLERHISGIGIDTLSPDRPENGFPVHKILLERGKYIIENVANLSALPSVGSFIMIAPLNIKEGTEAPVRLIGFVKEVLNAPLFTPYNSLCTR